MTNLAPEAFIPFLILIIICFIILIGKSAKYWRENRKEKKEL